jgi:hypothetical protein
MEEILRIVQANHDMLEALVKKLGTVERRQLKIFKHLKLSESAPLQIHAMPEFTPVPTTLESAFAAKCMLQQGRFGEFQIDGMVFHYFCKDFWSCRANRGWYLTSGRRAKVYDGQKWVTINTLKRFYTIVMTQLGAAYEQWIDDLKLEFQANYKVSMAYKRGSMINQSSKEMLKIIARYNSDAAYKPGGSNLPANRLQSI